MTPNDDLSSKRERELLAGFVLGDLSAEELHEFSESTEIQRQEDDLFRLEQAAAAVLLVNRMKTTDDMPASLRRRIQTQAEPQLRLNATAEARTDINTSPRTLPDSRLSTREVFAWFVAAASLLVACGLWFSNGATSSAVSLAKARDALKLQASDLIEVAWAPGTSPFKDKVAGDVVWSNLGQNGFMRFVGMPVNDPTVEQYQLWIIDPERDDEPIDGGVFDITSTDECLVEINAKLRVNRPVAFAVTFEKPGGVVVSTQERLPLLASVK